jgi:uncharacterized protein DUF6152
MLKSKTGAVRIDDLILSLFRTARLATALTSVLTVLMLCPPLHAHHSFGAEYDANQPVTITGVVTRIEWTNPHSFLFIDVFDSSGNKTNWKMEGYPPNVLSRTGWKRNVTLKVGDKVTVTGWHARVGGPLGHSREVTFANGQKLFFGPPAGTGEGGATAPVKVP